MQIFSKRALPLLLLSGLAVLSYYGVCFLEFTFDDRHRFVDNPGVKDFRYLVAFFLEPSWPGDLYRPLESVLLLGSYLLFGLNPLAQHLISLFLHLSITLTLFYVLSSWIHARWAFWSACLFAVHPLHVEAVANISYRSELLVAFWVVLALHFLQHYLHAERKHFLLLFSACFFIASLCKESSFVLWPLTAILLTLAPQPLNRRTLLCVGAALLVPSLMYLAMRYHALGMLTGSKPSFLVNPLASSSHLMRVLNAWGLLGQYLVLLFFPYPLRPSYSFAQIVPYESLREATLNLHFALGLLCAALALWGLWRRDRVGICCAAFLAAFAVTSNLAFPIGTIFAERLAYLPSIAFCIALATLCYKQGGQFILVLVTVLFVWRTASEVPYWQNNYTLFKRASKTTPRDSLVLSNFGYQLYLRGEVSAAIRQHLQAVEIFEYNKAALRGLVHAYFDTKQNKKTVYWLGKLFRLEPYDADLYLLLGEVFLSESKVSDSLDNLNKAQTVVKKALNLNPQNQKAQTLADEIRRSIAQLADESAGQ